MITIAGLTDRQRQIMDLLWSCESLDQVNTLIDALPTKTDQDDARGLIKIAIWETYEQELGLEPYREAAEAAIDHARS